MLKIVLAGLAVACMLASAHPSVNRDQGDIFKRAGIAAVYSKCTKPNTVAITFDDGPYEWTKVIVDTPNSAKVKGTFFWNGDNWQCIYSDANVERVRYAFKHGHQVASHTWSHADLAAVGTDIVSEMTKIDTALVKILGVKPAFIRPPYGSYNDDVRKAARKNKQSLVIWDFDSEDTAVDASIAQSEAAYTNIIEQHPSTILTLNHETKPNTVNSTLPFAIKALKDKGYKLVTVAECLGGKAPYVGNPKKQKKKDATWQC